MAHEDGIIRLAASASGKLVSGGGADDGVVKLWDVKTGHIISSTRVPGEVSALQFLDGEEFMASVGFLNLDRLTVSTAGKTEDAESDTEKLYFFSIKDEEYIEIGSTYNKP